MLFRLVSLLVSLWLLASCTLLQPQKEAALLGYQLQPIPSSLAHKSWQQKLQINQQPEILVSIELESDAMRLVALSASGVPLAQLSWSPQTGVKHIREPLIPIPWPQIIRDIQWVHWPIHAIEKGLPPSITVRQQQDEHGMIARLFENSTDLLAEVAYHPQQIALNNKAQGYSLRITLLN